MDKLNENINRIKQLMLVENNTQPSLFSGDEKPISINSDEFTKKYKEKVYFILKDLYQSNWDSDKSRGPSGGGGVVNIYTVYDLLKNKGLDDYDPEGGDWSIMNYFDTNPKVRKYIVGLYESETGDIIANESSMNKFITWMSKNRNKIFKEGPILEKLIELNTTSLYNGELNERKAYEYLTKILENISGWKLKGRSFPGSESDRNGIDFVMEKEGSTKIAKFQAKTLR